MEPELTTDRPAPPRRSAFTMCLVGAVAATLCCVGGVLTLALRHRIHTALATLDARLVLQLDSTDPAVAQQTSSILRGRLRRASLPGRVSRVAGGRIAIEHRAQDTDELRALATTRGELRFMLVVEGVSELERPGDVLSLAGEPLVVERPGLGGPGTFESVHRTLDGLGRPALGFELTVTAAEEFRALTGANVNRRLAIVLDDQVRSAPTIRSEIGRRGVIEGGANGWDEAELERMIDILNTDPLPAPLSVVPGE